MVSLRLTVTDEHILGHAGCKKPVYGSDHSTCRHDSVDECHTTG